LFFIFENTTAKIEFFLKYQSISGKKLQKNFSPSYLPVKSKTKTETALCAFSFTHYRLLPNRTKAGDFASYVCVAPADAQKRIRKCRPT
jgi:hypothetical protein